MRLKTFSALGPALGVEGPPPVLSEKRIARWIEDLLATFSEVRYTVSWQRGVVIAHLTDGRRMRIEVREELE